MPARTKKDIYTDYILETELCAVPQYERVARLKEVVPIWLEKITTDQALIIGLLPMLADWKEVQPIIIGPHMRQEFLDWVEEHKEWITCPNFMLPALQGFFQLVSIRLDYNPEVHGIPDTASKSLQATLERFALHLNQQTVS